MMRKNSNHLLWCQRWPKEAQISLEAFGWRNNGGTKHKNGVLLIEHGFRSGMEQSKEMT